MHDSIHKNAVPLGDPCHPYRRGSGLAKQALRPLKRKIMAVRKAHEPSGQAQGGGGTARAGGE